MAEARRAEEGWGSWGGRSEAPPQSPPARCLRERFWCISKLVEGIKTVFTTKRDTVGSTNSRSVFVSNFFPEISGGVQTPKTFPSYGLATSVRENVRNNSKNVNVFLDFEKKR